MIDLGIGLNIDKIRAEFPALHQQVNGHPLIYLDNAATTQKPFVVINAIENYYKEFNSNIHRGIHTLAEQATRAFEDTRLSVKEFINAKEVQEVIFTSGTTESINLLAHSFGKAFLNEGDEVLISTMEHHSNIVPWQLICAERKAILKVIPINDKGEIILEEYEKLLSSKTKIVAVVYVSNSLGTINPVCKIIDKAQSVGAKVFLDGAQASAHLEIDVQYLDCDFFAFSAHKVYGPTGVGVLYGKRELLEQMPPYKSGGEMIKDVSFEKTTFNDIPYKFEAGTPNISGVVAFKNALEFVKNLGHHNIAEYENALLARCNEGLNSINMQYSHLDKLPIRFIGTSKQKIGVCSFIVDGIHFFDLGLMLDARGIALRTGHHCTQPLMDRFCVDGTVRASFAVYNTISEVDRFIEATDSIISKMKKKTFTTTV